MKRFLFVAIVMFSAVVASAQRSFEKAADLGKTKAVVRLIAEVYVLEAADDHSRRWVAENLPEEYKKEGLEVTISGEEGMIPPNVRMVGTPLRLEKISVSAKVKKKMKLSKRKYKL